MAPVIPFKASSKNHKLHGDEPNISGTTGVPTDVPSWLFRNGVTNYIRDLRFVSSRLAGTFVTRSLRKSGGAVACPRLRWQSAINPAKIPYDNYCGSVSVKTRRKILSTLRNGRRRSKARSSVSRFTLDLISGSSMISWRKFKSSFHAFIAFDCTSR